MVLGEAGNDTVRGGTGSDTLWGGDGDDVIEPGMDVDDILLGSGSDTVRGTAIDLNGDLIRDFQPEDRLIILGGRQLLPMWRCNPLRTTASFPWAIVHL